MSIQLDDNDDETEFNSIEYLPQWMQKDIVVVCSHNKDHLHTYTPMAASSDENPVNDVHLNFQ